MQEFAFIYGKKTIVNSQRWKKEVKNGKKVGKREELYGTDMYLETLKDDGIKKSKENKGAMIESALGDVQWNRNNLPNQTGLHKNNMYSNRLHESSANFKSYQLRGFQDFTKPQEKQQSTNRNLNTNPEFSEGTPCIQIIRNCNCKTCADLLNEFCTTTSLHGLKFAGDRESHIIERIFWVLMFILAVLAAGYYISLVYEKWEETPVIVSIAAKATQMAEIPFPAVTICTMNEVRKSAAQRILKSNSKKDDIYKKMLHEFCNYGDKEYVPPDNISEDWDTLLSFMTKVRQPCHEMIVACYYSGREYNCSDIFNPSLTDEGICCSFNKVKRQDIFRNPRDLSDLNITFPMNSVDWTPENGYPLNTPSGTLPWRPRGAGSHLGLTLLLNAEIGEFYCSTSASKGFKLLLHNPVETPKVADYGSLIAPGREYRIKIRPTITNSSNSLKYVNEKERQCAFQKEKYLKFYKTYTQRNCILECEANYTLNVCKCVPYFLPKDVNTPICGRDDEQCTQLARRLLEMRMVDESALDLGNWTKPVCTCLPGCSELSFHTSMTYGALEPEYALKKGYLKLEDYNLTTMKWNLAVVHLFFTETQFLSYYKTELIGISDFLSSTGGLLGLFLGFSVISAVEIVYYMTIKLGSKLAKRRNNSTRHAPAHAISLKQNYPFVQ